MDWSNRGRFRGTDVKVKHLGMKYCRAYEWRGLADGCG